MFRICVVSGLIRAFVCSTKRSYRGYIGLGSSHRVFLRRALTGLQLDLRALFLDKFGHKGQCFADASYRDCLGNLFATNRSLAGLNWAPDKTSRVIRDPGPAMANGHGRQRYRPIFRNRTKYNAGIYMPLISTAALFKSPVIF